MDRVNPRRVTLYHERATWGHLPFPGRCSFPSLGTTRSTRTKGPVARARNGWDWPDGRAPVPAQCSTPCAPPPSAAPPPNLHPPPLLPGAPATEVVPRRAGPPPCTPPPRSYPRRAGPPPTCCHRGELDFTPPPCTVCSPARRRKRMLTTPLLLDLLALLPPIDG
jgi:hypothetical protein